MHPKAPALALAALLALAPFVIPPAHASRWEGDAAGSPRGAGDRAWNNTTNETHVRIAFQEDPHYTIASPLGATMTRWNVTVVASEPTLVTLDALRVPDGYAWSFQPATVAAGPRGASATLILTIPPTLLPQREHVVIQGVTPGGDAATASGTLIVL